MAIEHTTAYKDPELAAAFVEQIKDISKKPVRLMEVCGTHTMSIFRSGIRTLLPETISLLSGPGCPVCVTAQNEIDAFIAISGLDDVIVTSFGDLIRVPGTRSSLQMEGAKGRDIRIVYSTNDALEIARKNPEKHVVFLGVGFETTAPTVAASILTAKEMGLSNYYVLCAHKRIPPALTTLMEANSAGIDGFILPGHVSVIIGARAYLPFFDQYHIPSAIAGFEPTDILQTILVLVQQIETGKPELVNTYTRAVTSEGNRKARELMGDVFEIIDANWRGIGAIAQSGYGIRSEYAHFDAQKRFTLAIPDAKIPKGCICGEILTGMKTPTACSLYKKVCTPMNPVGACMVSSEGTCAAYYRYHGT